MAMKLSPKKPSQEVSGFNLQTDEAFKRIHRPKFSDRLKFPDDITELSPANVSDLLGKYTQMYAFANQELALVNVKLLALQTDESRRVTALFCSNPTLNQQERWRRDAVVDTDKKIQEISREVSLCKQKKEMLQMFLANYDRYLTALSRELSRKSHEQDLGRRNPV